MARIYISSTYQDLKPYRQAASDQLARMQLTAIAMEDYVARDDRPVDACVRDVKSSDLYVGLFAWRYGFIPKQDNPQKLSVTEFEHNAAKAHGIPRLLFLLDDAVAWPPALLDSHTGENDGGARIRDLRTRLSEDRLVSPFTSPDDLAAKLAAAVSLAGAVSKASDVTLDLSEIVSQDAIDRPEMLFNESLLSYLIQRLSDLGDSRLLKIDLRDGNYWWSTRLYAVATLAHEYTSVEWLLFLNDGDTYVGMARPAALKRALALAQPQLEEQYRQAELPKPMPGLMPNYQAAQVLQAMAAGFKKLPGGEEALRFFVGATWIAANVPGLSTFQVQRSGTFDPLATSQLLGANTPFVPITDGTKVLKVVDRIGVATEIARSVVERQLGRT